MLHRPRRSGSAGRLPWAGVRTDKNYAVQGNLLEGAEVVDTMAAAFEAASGDLASRLVYALGAGRQALLENPTWRHLPPSSLQSLGVSPELVAALLEVESFRRLWESLAPEKEGTP